ncbi:MAG: YbaN family protein [Sphingobium sp.]
MSMNALAEPEPGGRLVGRAEQVGWLTLGFLCVGLRFVGAVVPLMLTTIFLTLATGRFARSSPWPEAWLLAHPRFAASLQRWRAEGAISRAGKCGASVGMAVGYDLFLVVSRPGWIMALAIAAMMIACACVS